MLNGIIGNNFVSNRFLRFSTDSGAGLDPTITTVGATSEWISPDGSISTGATPNPVLDQTGAYVVKCSDWSDVSRIKVDNDHLIILANLHVLTALDRLDCYTNSISVLDVATLVSMTTLYCQTNNISTLDVSALTALTLIWCQDNNMNQTNVDKILADLVTAGANNGTAKLSGTNAAPSAAGLANKAILEAAPRNWTVTVS